MSKQARLKDGTILEFPDNTSDEVIDRAVKAHIDNPSNDSRLKGLVGGSVKPVDNLAAWASRMPVVGPAVDELGQALGMPSAADAVASNQAMRANNSRTGYQMLGNILGTLPVAALPGGVVTQGAASGALLSDAGEPGGLMLDAAVGAAGGKLGDKTARAVGQVIAPRVSPIMRRLHDMGVQFTPGQLLSGSKGLVGRSIAGVEEAATSIPYVGDAINLARAQGVNAYERGLGNRALGNIGMAVPKAVQPGGVAEAVGRGLSNRYDRLVPNLRANFDDAFTQDLAGAQQFISSLPAARQRQFRSILGSVFENRAGPRAMFGEPVKEAESRLTGLIRQYSKGGDDGQIAEGLKVVRQALRNSIQRSNPGHAAELAGLNRGWAQNRVLKQATEAGADVEAGFPNRVFQAQRRSSFNDPVVRRAAAVLPNKTPDSGTARRAMIGLGGNAVASGAAGALLGPAAVIPGLLAAAAYSKPGMKALNKAVFAPRGPVAKAVAKGTRALPALFPGLGPLSLLALTGRLGD